MKIKGHQVYAERMELIPGLTAKTYVVAKGRPGGVIEMVMLAIHSSGDDKIKNIQRVFIVNGEENILDTQSDITHGQVKTFIDPVYLADGHEMALRFQGEKVDSPCQIFIHYLWHIDEV